MFNNNDDNQDRNGNNGYQSGYDNFSGKDPSQNSYGNSDWQTDGTPKSVWSADGYGDAPFADSQKKEKDDYAPAYVDNSYSNSLGNAFAGLGGRNFDNNDDKKQNSDNARGYGNSQESYGQSYSQPANSQPVRPQPTIESRPVQRPQYDGYGDTSYSSAAANGNVQSFADRGFTHGGQNERNGYSYSEPVAEISEQETLPEITREEQRMQEKQAFLAQREEERKQALQQKQQARQDAINQKEQARQAKEQAKLDKQAEKDRAKQDKIDQKQQAIADKEQAKQQALAQKEQAKQDALAKKEQERQQKEQAKLDANADKEKAKLDKQNKKDADKQAKEQAKFEKQNKIEQEKQAKEQAKLDKKQAKEQAKLDKKLDKKNKKLKNVEEVQPLADNFEDMNEYQEDTRRRAPEERDMLGGDFMSAQPVAAPVQNNTANAETAPQQTGYVPKFVSNDVDTILVTLPDKEHMTKKQKKIAKKASRFDEMDLRNYPMTVGKWIGTFIVMLIPLVNFIAGICWFFGVGNKSRTAFVRSIFVICLILTVLLAALLGVGYYFLAQKAQEETGAQSFNEVLIYGANWLCDTLSGVVGEDKIEPVRQKIIGFLEGLGSTSTSSTSAEITAVFIE